MPHPPPQSTAGVVDAGCAADLALARAALAGDRAAIAEVERTCVAPLDGGLAALIEPADVDEVKQRVRHRLLVADGAAGGRLAAYQGRGPLRAFVRVVAVREALRVRRERLGQVGAEALELPVSDDDPSLRLLRARHAEAFRAAFEAALAGLAPADRTLLRQQLLDGLGVEALAALHRVHRVTMFRRLGKVRAALLARTRRELAGRLAVERGELDSLMRAVASDLELTLERVLKAEG